VTNPLLDPGRRLVIGHRGAAAEAPENTLPSFERAAAIGVDALEFDVHVTADGHAVVIHDPTLRRTTGRDGAVASLTLEQLRAADAGARFTLDGRSFPFRGRGVRVPTVEEVLVRFPAMPLLIELKTAAASEALRRTIARHAAEDRCVIGSFDDAAVAPFRAPPWHVTASQADVLRLLAQLFLGRPPGAARYEALSIPPTWHGLPLPVGRIARASRARGRPVHIWVVDSPHAARRLWARGACGIISNDPAAIVPGRAAG
jgi:glycerophosphoryl diester phosphodiesterase